MTDRTTRYILILLLVPILIFGTFTYFTTAGNDLTSKSDDKQGEFMQITEEPIEPSNPTNVVIRETAKYNAPVGDNEPIAFFTGVLYWEELAGAGLQFFINTSKVISAEFKDFETKDPINFDDNCQGQTNCVADLGDRYLIIPSGRSFQYEIESYYEPDIIEDTGFIVVFNSQSVDFSIEIGGQNAYARTDYYNRITLPKGAGIVSYAPIDDGFQRPIGKTDDGRWVLEWEYINREMDSKHDPLMISVTYTYDEIFLAFTEQVYQNQIEQQQQQEEINRLNLIRQSFAVISTLAVIASLFSIFFAYLLARRKYENDLQRAKELPRREAADIEDSPPLKVPVKSMFLTALIILPIFFNPIIMVDGQAQQDDVVVWNGTYDLRRDFTLTEIIEMELPVQRDEIYVYTNTSQAISFHVYNEFGNEINHEEEDNRFIIPNPGFEFSYELERPYTVNNNSNMLVWTDRFWLEFRKPNDLIDPQEQDPFFNVDMEYTVLLPRDAILYSASPSELLEVQRTDGRVGVHFEDDNRRMDAFHDVFETQVTFSFIGIIDALENLDSDFVQVQPEEQSLDSLVRVAAEEVLIFAILGIIAPLISFIIAYWVFRRRYKKMIDRAEKEQEEQIFVEKPQIEALTAATDEGSSQRVTDAFMGHYYRAIEFLSEELDTDVTRFDNTQILEIIRRSDFEVDTQLVMEIINLGNSIQPEDAVGYDQMAEMAKLVDEMIASTEEGEY